MTMAHLVGKYPLIPLYILCIALCYPVLGETEQAIRNVTAKGKFGEGAVLTCVVSPHNLTAKWLFEGTPVVLGKRVTQSNTTKNSGKDKDGGDILNLELTLKIANTTDQDAGNYSCVAGSQEKSVILDLSYPGKLVYSTKGPIRINITEGSAAKPTLNLSCSFEVYNQTKVEWILQAQSNITLETESTRDPNNAKLLNSSYSTPIAISSFDIQNGTYICQAWDPVALKYISGQIDVFIYARPVLDIQHAVAISSSQIYFNWTVKNFNSPIVRYDLSVLSDRGYTYEQKHRIDTRNTSYVMGELKNNTSYNIQLKVNTEFGSSNPVMFPTHGHEVKTLSEDPIFVPNISINGFSAKSMTIGLTAPPPKIAEYVHYYLLEAWKKDSKEPKQVALHQRDDRNLPYMFSNLDPHSTYVFRARACSEYTHQCGAPSEEMEAVTLDGIPDKPTNVTIECPKQDDRSHMALTWGPPAKPNAEIKGYMMEVTGNMTYIDRFGVTKTDTWGPLSKFMANDSRSVRVDDLKPNTRYTVRLSAMTRTRRRGLEEVAYCKTEPGPPDNPPRPRWRKHGEKVEETIKYSLRVLVPRSSERNGPICCYRVYLVRLLPGLGWSKLPPPQGLPVLSYQAAHSPTPELGAYVTDVFNNENFPTEELTLGDEKSLTLAAPLRNGTCARCFAGPRPKEPPRTRPPPTTAVPEYDDDTTAMLDEEVERRDRRAVENKFANDEILKNKEPSPRDAEPLQVFDGKLDSLANYTLFVELIPGTDDEPLYSGYTVALNTAIPPVAVANNTMELALQICCAVAALLLLGTVVFCVVHSRRSRKLPPRHAHVELNPIQAALRYVVGHIGGRQQLVSATPPDMPPIPIDELAAAYAERQADSDYGFQKEFELLQMLPECFPDRTTHASEARENQPKNRYPDIKAYDQTRVKLSQIDGITGSDYINANYVMGYKEQKQFICAQGPTETTVNDFWRMIWEHGLELIVMLTNLEEYSKVKCSKYWPDEVRGSRAFGAITVNHVSEKRYSDYIVRELKITKQPTNSEGQPIVENNGVAKRNGDCKDAESASAPTSPREVKDSNTRTVRQYHFLMWKDFAAPEHPQSILKFIKRVNEAWSGQVGRPVVVHCSAGVGRTGTLVALDCLLAQLKNERRCSVFSTVCELRRQRNFLVQSLKQYVFVYRALVEYAHYGDTEIPASRLKASIDRLRNTPEGADKCLMEHEFEKMMNPPVTEPVKSCAAGAVEEARARNRSPDCLPYDRNRVILTPAPPNHYCTYINASFIEAYDNSEGYIITQDPLPNTITDFWRMASEHNVSTIVMLSELGEGKCPRYWDDGTAQYEHISVQYEESESCPYYTRRQFRVVNNKSGDVTSVRQLQYHGWPTAPGHVPEVTRGLAELADAARTSVAPHPSSTCVMHCQYGTERSALFCALCILIAQLRTERRVDVAACARKVRSMRARTIDTFLQYEFLHRAILNYAELHNLLEDS